MNKIIFSVFALISLGFLNACATTPNTVGNLVSSPDSVIQTPKKADPVQDEITPIVSTGDYLKCQELQEVNQIGTCETIILTDKALTSNDSSWCQKATSTEVESACQSSFDKPRDNSALQPDILDQTIAAGDFQKCLILTNDAEIRTCESNILTDKALASNDSSWCQKATLEESKTDCLNTMSKENK